MDFYMNFFVFFFTLFTNSAIIFSTKKWIINYKDMIFRPEENGLNIKKFKF